MIRVWSACQNFVNTARELRRDAFRNRIRVVRSAVETLPEDRSTFARVDQSYIHADPGGCPPHAAFKRV